MSLKIMVVDHNISDDEFKKIAKTEPPKPFLKCEAELDYRKFLQDIKDKIMNSNLIGAIDSIDEELRAIDNQK